MTVHVSESGARHAYTTLAGDRETPWISMYAIARRTAPAAVTAMSLVAALCYRPQ